MSAEIIPVSRKSPPKTAIDRAFLPAALEIVETPASPSVRWTGMLICLFLTVAVIWSWFGEVDLIAAAPGKVVPTERTKQVQAFEAGVVRQILVDDGSVVKAGQTLILLDPTLAGADRDRYQDQLTRAQLDIARLGNLLNVDATGVKTLKRDDQENTTANSSTKQDPFVGISAPEETLAEARGHLAADRAGRDAKLAAADRTIAEKRADRAGLVAEIAKIDAALPLVAERASIRKASSEKQWGSRIDYLTAAQTQVEMENERKVTLEKLGAIDAAIQAQMAERARIAAETERDWRVELQKASHDRAEAQSELAKAERRTGLTSVTAPVDGIVQDLSVHTEGGVVQAGQQLLHVVPNDGAVAIEVVVENKDAGFVRAGQDAEIKVDAFPFTRYGLLHGKVTLVARDAAPDPETQQQTRVGTSPLGTAPNELRRSEGLVYVARISVADPTLDVDGKRQRLEPGMAITAEIKTGKRRVLDYILSPIAQRAHDALRER